MMKFKGVLVTTVFVIMSGLGCSFAAAEYQLTIFPEGKGYQSIQRGNAREILADFEYGRLRPRDFLDLNNICVSQILANRLENAILSCRKAVEQVPGSRTVAKLSKRKALATIYSNLAVARAKSGDLQGALNDLGVALNSYSPNSSAKINMDQITSMLVADLQD